MKLINKTLILCLAANGACIHAQEIEKPNFIIMIADDADWSDYGAYGNPAIQTPNIDQLARDGMKFNNAFLTTSSCSPSRISIMTGRYPHNTGAHELGTPMPPEKVIFPGELQKAGYYTAAAGKWHLGPQRDEFDNIYGRGGPSGCGNWELALQERPKDKPFFMWLAAVDPHRPYEPGIIPEPHDPSEVIVPPYLPDNDSTRKDLALYYDEISRLDSFVGKVLDILKEQGVERNTIVIFMSDNGMPFPRAKNRLYDSGIQTPFIVRWPQVIKPGTVSASLISSIDIFPTFCELAGVEIPESAQGISFAPVLRNPNKITRDRIFAEQNWHDFTAHQRAVRTNRFLYIWNAHPELNAQPSADVARGLTFVEMIRQLEAGSLGEPYLDCFISPRPVEELYDVVADPHQMTNLASKTQYQDTLNKMRNKLNEWKEATQDYVPENPRPDRGERWKGKIPG